MRGFICPNCGQRLAFEDVVCMKCGGALVFSPEKIAFSVVVGTIVGRSESAAADQPRMCADRHVARCNWLAAGD